MSNPDFAAIKERVSLVQAIQMLQLQMKQAGHQYRSACPTCQSGGDRALAVTPDKGFYCHSLGKGGSVIDFVAHIRNVSAREAAQILSDHFRIGSSNYKAPGPAKVKTEVEQEGSGEFQALDYLVFDHQSVETFGLPAATAKVLGIGYAPKGTLRGCVAIPVYLPNQAQPSGYIGIDLEHGEIKLPKEWHYLPQQEPEPEVDANVNVVRFPKRA
ncbi:MAG TPA: CHC2 zinc finger domain-containing protein [Xanthobacteraceae bacterium]|jgi:DNA primase|nr:CHC2 zinc finger domain-containing protein [Xanthobacteraceae bacterium]